MISSLVVTGCYNIGRNASNKISVSDNILSVEKDIPFIRYRFNTYTDKEYSYIENSMTIFEKSTHLAEINLTDDTLNVVNRLVGKRVALFIYTDITDSDIEHGSFSESVLANAKSLAELGANTIDRFMIRDKTTSLDTVTAEKFIKQLATVTGINKKNFGICGSPLSFGEYACLTAVKAREIMSKYNTTADVALPSANHQNMNTCGCIRYFVIDSDTVAPPDSKAKTVKKSSDSTDGEPKAAAKPKTKIRPGMFNI